MNASAASMSILNASGVSNGSASPLAAGYKSPGAPPPTKTSICRSLYGYIRILCIIIHNCYHVPAYLFLTWIILLPVYFVHRAFYYRVENYLYNWCLYTVSGWSWLAGIQVVECGDDIYSLFADKTNGNNNEKLSVSSSLVKNSSSAASPLSPNSPTRNVINASAAAASHADGPAVLGTTPNGPDSGPRPGAGRQLAAQQSSRAGRLLVLGNHQSTGDVPLMFQAFSSVSKFVLLWVMDHQFKFTNFGVVSHTHGDFFIKPRAYVKSLLTKHCAGQPDKDCIILFPEGGFRYKREESSNRFATKQGLPLLRHLTWPRAGAFADLVDDSLGVTHVVDLTILYASQETPISILDIGTARRAQPVYFHYRIFDVRAGHEQLDEQWLNARWYEKEQLMAAFYAAPQDFLKAQAGALRPVTLSWLKMINIHIFYLAVSYWMYLLVVFAMAGFRL